MVDRRDANLKVLNDASEIQDQTALAIQRMQKQLVESEDVGAETLQRLGEQGRQMDSVNAELESVSHKLDQASKLQTVFDRWAGNWLGGKKSKAEKEAQMEIYEANIRSQLKVREVFEQEKFDSLTRSWKPSGMVLCTDTSVSAKDIFDPNLQTAQSSWAVDYSIPNIDAEGWTYAASFSVLDKSGKGESSAKWNSYARRRKWKYTERKSALSGKNEEIVKRNDARKATAAGSSQAEKIGYTPRNQRPVGAGLTVTDARSKTSQSSNDQDLDDESRAGLERLKQRDQDIDRGLDVISNSVDKLANIAKDIGEETRSHTAKLNRMEELTQINNEKQTVINARLRHQLK